MNATTNNDRRNSSGRANDITLAVESADALRHRPARPEKKDKKRSTLIGFVVLVVGVLSALYYLKFVAPFESTDDAFIDGHVTTIAPQVSGRVDRVLVNDNQYVQAGELLVQIDPSDLQAKLEQQRADLASANGRLAQAKAQSTADKARIEQEKANIIAAEAEAKRAEADSKRYDAVGIAGESQSQLDLAATQARSAAAQLVVAKNRDLAAEAQVFVDQASIQSAEAEVQSSEAAVHQAELNLSYTQVRAHIAGYVTHRTVEADSFVQPGQALLALVPKDVWVTANFKETQLTHMGVGQPVKVRVDAYPHAEFTGRVDSIQTGAGARFSLFPPENATGNYVKVVQRVPVKIVLDDSSRDGLILGPGMSVVPKVHVK
jgi:membrane fusion protein (multidrug efflux system)